MNNKISVVFTTILIITMAIFIVPSSVFQLTHAQNNSDLQSTILNIHNREREEVGSPDLTWSTSLANDAQGWANHLATLGLVCNAQRCDQTPHGATNENLAGGSPGFSVASMVQSWANEKSSYNGGPIPSGFNPAGHYTAMVWQNTKQVGCATANTNTMDFLVCRYDPPGNFIGQFPYNTGASSANQAVTDEESTFAQGQDNAAGVDNNGNTNGDTSGNTNGDTSGNTNGDTSGNTNGDTSRDSGEGGNGN